MDSAIGAPVRRKEDFRLLRGAGRYSDDVNLPGQAWGLVVRSCSGINKGRPGRRLPGSQLFDASIFRHGTPKIRPMEIKESPISP